MLASASSRIRAKASSSPAVLGSTPSPHRKGVHLHVEASPIAIPLCGGDSHAAFSAVTVPGIAAAISNEPKIGRLRGQPVDGHESSDRTDSVAVGSAALEHEGFPSANRAPWRGSCSTV